MDGGHSSDFSAPPQKLVTGKIESCEHNYILPALFSIILGITIITYIYNQYWRNFKAHEVKFHETSSFMIGLAVLCPTILCVCRVLYRAYSKNAPILVLTVSLGLILCLITGLLWKSFTIVSKTSNNDSERVPNVVEHLDRFANTHADLNLEKPIMQEMKHVVQEERSANTQANLEQEKPLKQKAKYAVKEEQLAMPEQTPPVEEKPSKGISSFNHKIPDCKTYSKQLLSETTLIAPEKYPDGLKGQVDMFNKVIHLTGSSEPGSGYTASALYIMDRHLITGGNSYTSVKDAMEKALIKMCENLRAWPLCKN